MPYNVDKFAASIAAKGLASPNKFQVEFSSVPGECLICLLYTSPSPRDRTRSRMPSSA